MSKRKSKLALAGALVGLMLLVGSLIVAWQVYGPDEWSRASPYSALAWDMDHELPRGKFDGSWYRLQAINGIPTQQVMAFCRSEYSDDDWAHLRFSKDLLPEKRFSEDLCEVLDGMGVSDPSRVGLTLKNLDNAEVRIEPNVKMTHDKRRAIMATRHPGQGYEVTGTNG